MCVCARAHITTKHFTNKLQWVRVKGYLTDSQYYILSTTTVKHDHESWHTAGSKFPHTGGNTSQDNKQATLLQITNNVRNETETQRLMKNINKESLMLVNDNALLEFLFT